MKLLGHSFIVGFWTLASRILGFVRDVLFAAILGTGPAAEAFLVAFALPNMFRRIFAEGALNLVFVPIYAKKITAGDDPDRFVSEVFSNLVAVLLLLVLVALLAMPVLVLAMASGFAGDDRLDLAVLYGRIAFPYIFFVSLAAMVSAALNSLGRFWAAAAAPILLNALFIVSLVAAARFEIDPGIALSWTVPLAGLAQLAMVFIFLRRAGVRIRPRMPRLSDDMRRLLMLALPAMLSGGVIQVNLLIGRQVASYQEGGVAWLNYADRLCQLPLGVIGIAIGIVLLPDLSRKLEEGDDVGSRHSFNRAIEASMALTVPAAMALAVAALPIISILFERGEFSTRDSQATALALVVYAAGLPAFVLQKIYQPLFFAREDSRSPMRYALASMVINALIAVGLVQAFGYIAAAVGTTVSAWAMLGMLVRGSLRMGRSAGIDRRNRWVVPRILISSILMGIILHLVLTGAVGLFAADTIRYLALMGMVVLGVVVYFVSCMCLGTWSVGEIRKIATWFGPRGDRAD